MILEDGAANSRELVVHAAHGDSVCVAYACFLNMDKVVKLRENIVSRE